MGESKTEYFKAKELFFSEKYKGYQVRGKTTAIGSKIFNKQTEFIAFYTFAVFVLVKDEYLSSNTIDFNDPLSFFGIDKTDYLKKIELNAYNDLRSQLDIIDHPFYQTVLKDISASKGIEPQTINSSDKQELLKDFDALWPKMKSTWINMQYPTDTFKDTLDCYDYDYIQDGIKQNQDIIFLRLLFEPGAVLDLNNNLLEDEIPNIYRFLACNFSAGIKAYPDQRYNKTLAFFSRIYDKIVSTFKHEFMSKNDFLNMLGSIADLSFDLIFLDTMNKAYLDKFNLFADTLKPSDSPLVQLCYLFLHDLVSEIELNNIASICTCCGHLYIKKPKQIEPFCSRECYLKAYGKDYYKDHNKELRKKSSENIQDMREYLKEQGINKHKTY